MHKLGFGPLFRSIYNKKNDKLKRNVFGLEFDNPVGLAAGFDKDALLSHVRDAGYGPTIAQFDTGSMRTKAGLKGPELSEQEFSAKVTDVWGKLTSPTRRAMPRLR